MTTDITRTKNNTASDNSARSAKGSGVSSSRAPAPKTVNPRDRRVSGYTRIKSGEHKRRSVSRTPDMSNPDGKVLNPRVSLGSLPAVKREKAIPVAKVRTEPTVRTINETKKEAFPFSIVFLSLVCSVLFVYMIFNYVKINEHTASISDLRSEIKTLEFDNDNLITKIDNKNDLNMIEKIAREELGMVKIDDIAKKYITMNPDDVISSYGKGTLENK